MGPQLACAVLSLRSEPQMVNAVRSLLVQEPMPEVVVVNSGGGDAAAILRRAGLDVPLVDEPQRLYPGGARNRGIEASSAPYMAFLAADSTAEPGWVAGRLRHHADGADAVACALTCPRNASRSAAASHLLLNLTRLPDAPPHRRLLYGLSYDRALFDRFGLFREDLRIGEDSEFRKRILESATIAWAPHVRTQHHGPSTVRALLRDQYRRGRRRELAEQALGIAPERWKLVTLAMRTPRMAFMHALRMTDREERRAVLRGWPMLLPGSLAYLAGRLSARPR